MKIQVDFLKVAGLLLLEVVVAEERNRYASRYAERQDG